MILNQSDNRWYLSLVRDRYLIVFEAHILNLLGEDQVVERRLILIGFVSGRIVEKVGLGQVTAALSLKALSDLVGIAAILQDYLAT